MTREDEHPTTAFFLRRPVTAACLSGLVIGVWVILGGLPALIAVPVALGTALGQWLIWREGGPGYRWRQAYLRRFPKKD